MQMALMVCAYYVKCQSKWLSTEWKEGNFASSVSSTAEWAVHSTGCTVHVWLMLWLLHMRLIIIVCFTWYICNEHISASLRPCFGHCWSLTGRCVMLSGSSQSVLLLLLTTRKSYETVSVHSFSEIYAGVNLPSYLHYCVNSSYFNSYELCVRKCRLWVE